MIMSRNVTKTISLYYYIKENCWNNFLKGMDIRPCGTKVGIIKDDDIWHLKKILCFLSYKV